VTKFTYKPVVVSAIPSVVVISVGASVGVMVVGIDVVGAGAMVTVSKW